MSAITTVLGVDIITPGGGYIGPPRLKFNDSCNKGKGATGRAVVENGQVVQVIIDNSGIDYLPSPDGSQGGDGRIWAESDETTVKRDDGTYDIPYKPGEVISVFTGDQVTEPGGNQVSIIESTTITTKSPQDVVPRGTSPILNTGDYPVVLEVEDINILDPGFGYDENDEVVIGNGAELKIKTDALGSVTGVNVINGGIGFTEDPDLYIKSDTGYNAKLIPVFKVNRVDPDIAPSAAVVQVIDCVGKF